MSVFASGGVAGTPVRGSPPELVIARPAEETLQAVRRSCQWLSRNEDSFLTAFHRRLVELIPALQQWAVEDSRQLSVELARVLLWAASAHEDPQTVEDTVRRVGTHARSKGFPEDAYLSLGHAVLRAARALHQADWNSALSANWVAYVTWLSAHLETGAAQVRAMRTDTPTMATARIPGPAPAPTRPGPLGSGPLRSGPLQPSPTQPSPLQPSPLQPSPTQPEPDGAVTPPDGTRVGRTVADGRLPASLDDVLALLRERHFVHDHDRRALRCPAEARQSAAHDADDERELGSICVRIAVRTGADLRSPRPEQRTDPALIADVLDLLLKLGYPLVGAPEAAPPGGQHAQPWPPPDAR